MQVSDTALVVIDVQESFRHRDYWETAHVAAFSDRLQALVDGARALSIPIVQIFHVEEQGAFSLASGHVRTLEPLSIVPDALFHKHRHSALVGSGLPVWLAERGIRRLIVSGIRTEQCCETTTRHASDLGWQVDYVTEATHTMALTDKTGRTWSVEELKARTAAVLDGRFARVCSIAEALAGAPKSAAA